MTGASPNEPRSSAVSVSLHGPGVTIGKMIEVGAATIKLLEAIGDELGEDVQWEVVSVHFQCDGCGAQRPDRPRPDEGWTHSDGDDLCPTCSHAGDPS